MTDYRFHLVQFGFVETGFSAFLTRLKAEESQPHESDAHQRSEEFKQRYLNRLNELEASPG